MASHTSSIPLEFDDYTNSLILEFRSILRRVQRIPNIYRLLFADSISGDLEAFLKSFVGIFKTCQKPFDCPSYVVLSSDGRLRYNCLPFTP